MEYSSIANDSYLFFLDLNKKTREAIVATQEEIQQMKNDIVLLEQKANEKKVALKELDQGLSMLKQKEMDLQGMIADLDKNKAHFKNIVTSNNK